MDDLIPAQATTNAAQVIVANMPSMLYWLATTPTIATIPTTYANELSVLVYMRRYTAALTKYASAFMSISGADSSLS